MSCLLLLGIQWEYQHWLAHRWWVKKECWNKVAGNNARWRMMRKDACMAVDGEKRGWRSWSNSMSGGIPDRITMSPHHHQSYLIPTVPLPDHPVSSLQPSCISGDGQSIQLSSFPMNFLLINFRVHCCVPHSSAQAFCRHYVTNHAVDKIHAGPSFFKFLNRILSHSNTPSSYAGISALTKLRKSCVSELILFLSTSFYK